MTPPRRAALFLDRDGVINEDCGHCHRVEQWVWVPGVLDTSRTAVELGLALVVVTNQAGIARGLYDEARFHSLTDWMKRAFADAGAPLTAVYFCPSHPEGKPPYNIASADRKPAPGMLLRAANEHALDLARSVIIGDMETDIEAGQAAGLMRTARLCRGEPPETKADHVFASHADAQRWLLATYQNGVPV